MSKQLNLIEIFGTKGRKAHRWSRDVVFDDFSQQSWYIDPFAVRYADPAKNVLCVDTGNVNVYFKVSGRSTGFEGVIKAINEATL